MQLTEIHYIPYSVSPLFPGPWIVFAPHPDDETYGMGGTIAAARAAGIQVHVVVVTDGALGGEPGDDLIETREREVRAAVAVLGGTSLTFWRAPDRGLVPDANRIAAAEALLLGQAGGTVFFPSPVEPHPDHRATSVLVWEALRRCGFPVMPVAYEISVQGPCNRLIDVTPWIEVKRCAMAEYQSQESERPYARRILALNTTRSWSLPDTVEFAEGFNAFPLEDAPLDAVLTRLRQRDAEGVRIDTGSVPSPDDEDTEIESPELELARIKASRSWRLTEPLRALARRLRGETRPRPTRPTEAASRPILLIVLATNHVGGVETQSRIRFQGLASHFRLVVLTHEALRPHFADLLAPETSNQAIELVTFESFGLVNPFDYRPENFLAYARAIAIAARETGASLLYGVMHNSTLYMTIAYWRHYRTLRGRRLIGSLHGSLLGYFKQRGHGASLTERALIRLALKTCDVVITPSVGVGRELIERFGARRARIASIHNGADLEHICSLGDRPLAFEKTRPWILTCCRLADQKDFRTLIAAFSRVDIEPLPLLVVVGEGPMRGQITAWADEYGVGGRLYLAGFQENPFNWIRHADLFVLSSHYEGFGNVLVEAMALGVPVAASDCPWGPGEIIEPGESGALFPIGDDAALAQILNHWLAKPSERARLAEGARKRASVFSAERMIENYRALFQRLS
ncbi:glycosyltransferase [Thiocapsa sp. UBA6158]|uniref:glycosyltransferase n=1 Tax=Thiocapsa sp. UBA6158 TaxID=1947692 RepID=UPI0025F4877F|nr:glycosyltransferase [Thiocapsa sp. UBA6158]